MSEQYRVLRGGSWYDYGGGARSAYRYWDRPDFRDDFIGLRLCAYLSEDKMKEKKQHRVIRGGSWFCDDSVRSAVRGGLRSDYCDNLTGLRFCADLREDKMNTGKEQRHVSRGGGWLDCNCGCRSSFRRLNQPGKCDADIGFRICAHLPGGNKLEEKEQFHARRGGCWCSDMRKCRSAGRGNAEPAYRFDATGFRICACLQREDKMKEKEYRVLRGGCWDCIGRGARSAFRGRYRSGDCDGFLGLRFCDSQKAKVCGPGCLLKRDEYGIYTYLTIDGEPIQRMRFIPPGKFMMGSPKSELNRFEDETLHEVTLTRGFWLADTLCTQELWHMITGLNPSKNKGPNHPVEMVSWCDCVSFLEKCGKRVKMGGIDVDLRLPTEAEWEYACRAGTITMFNTGDTLTMDQANYDGRYQPVYDTKTGYTGKTTPVASYAPNKWGLYDMHGNVWEWCADWYGDYTEKVDPVGAVGHCPSDCIKDQCPLHREYKND